MSIFNNNNNIHNKKNYADSEKSIFSLPNNNTYKGPKHSIKIINDNMSLKISPSNKKKIMSNNISLRTQILSKHGQKIMKLSNISGLGPFTKTTEKVDNYSSRDIFFYQNH